MVDNRPIIVFDSGIGGLSIYKPLKAALPSANIVYITDSPNFPYGEKSPSWLSSRFRELCKQFEALDPLMVVLACNTATTNIITQVRGSLNCPVVGVEPVIKPLAQFGAALALMTESSANSTQVQHLLKQYGQHVQIYSPSGLAEAIEFNDYEQVKKYIHEITKIVQKQQIEAVGLSCTHYALIAQELEQAMPGVTIIDPSLAVVREVVRVLKLSEP